jgi:hypothetical protein
MTTPTLEEIRRLYPEASYAPDPDCPHCGGTGRRQLRVPETGTARYPCACIFLGPATSDVLPLLAETARKLRAEMEEYRRRGEYHPSVRAAGRMVEWLLDRQRKGRETHGGR